MIEIPLRYLYIAFPPYERRKMGVARGIECGWIHYYVEFVKNSKKGLFSHTVEPHINQQRYILYHVVLQMFLL